MVKTVFEAIYIHHPLLLMIVISEKRNGVSSYICDHERIVVPNLVKRLTIPAIRELLRPVIRDLGPKPRNCRFTWYRDGDIRGACCRVEQLRAGTVYGA